jgi:low affinity Fe/Cu permease
MTADRDDMANPTRKHWTTHAGQAAGHPAAFVVVVVYALLWLAFDPATFDWDAVATLAVFVMTLFIQRTNRRDNLALHAKLDELLRVDHDARSPSLMRRSPKPSSATVTRKSAGPMPENRRSNWLEYPAVLR